MCAKYDAAYSCEVEKSLQLSWNVSDAFTYIGQDKYYIYI